MNTLIPFLFLVLYTPYLKAQTDVPLVKIQYKFTHVLDTLQRDKPHIEDMVLFVGKTSTLFGNYEEEQRMNALAEQVKSGLFDGHLTIIGSGTTPSPTFFYHHPSKNSKAIHQIGSKKYIVNEEYPDLTWELLEDTKEILGHPCQAAQTSHGGRKYNAWFNTTLQLVGAPWKLQGLPGVLFEVQDEQGEVKFEITSLEPMEPSTRLIGTDPALIPASAKELLRLREAVQNSARLNPNNILSTPPNRGSTHYLVLGGGYSDDLNSLIDPSQIKSVNVIKNGPQISKTINNPIEKNKR